MKPTIVFQAPIFTLSGYGKHSIDILKSLYKSGKYDIKIIPTRWGATPQNQTYSDTEFGKWALQSIIDAPTVKPDIYIQISVPNEFTPMGKYNIGITAGAETNMVPIDFIEGANRMDLIITPSQFTKLVMEGIEFEKRDVSNNNILVDTIKLKSPIEVVHEGVDVDLYEKSRKLKILNSDKVQSFCFLIVGHWLSGDLGEDRKNIPMTLKTIASTFEHLPKDKRPGIILKTSNAGFSVGEREVIRNRIYDLFNEYEELPIDIHLLYGELTDEEMFSLYKHPKVKAMVSFTKGEGYGRPLAEFALTGKPIIVSNWSGHLDFLSDKYISLVEGTLTPVHPSAANKFLMKESSWFTINYTQAASVLLKTYLNYDKELKRSIRLSDHMKANFSIELMDRKMIEIIDKSINTIPKVKPFKIPNLKK